MKCDVGEELTSAAADEPLPQQQAAALRAHQESCSSCRGFADDILVVRQRLRVRPLGHVPDVTAGVRARLESQPHHATATREPDWLRAAAAFIAAFVVSGLVVASLAPTPVLAENLSQRVLAAQSRVTALSADLTVTERGWHPDVLRRRYAGEVTYRAPESLRLRLDDLTAYPSRQWQPNNIEFYVDDHSASVTGLRPCPPTLQPSCSASGPWIQTWRGRGPFDDDVPAPLDLIVPATSFALTGPVHALGTKTIAGVEALGVRITAAQAAPLLDGILGVGNWRQVHPSDVADVWLDAAAMTPLTVDVLPADGVERRLWAAARGLDDQPGQPILEVTFANVRFDQQADAVTPPAHQAADVRHDAGFVGEPDPPHAVTPAWLPDGLTQHRQGRRGGVTITAWSDGRAWLRVEATPSWKGDRLFGNLGELVRPVASPGGMVYVGRGGAAVALHTDELDVAIHGSYDVQTMARIAQSLPLTGQAVPPHWAEGQAVTVEEAAAMIPALLFAEGLEGFAQPAVQVDGRTATTRYVGAGSRGFVVTQAPGSVLSPPFDADVLGVSLRGRAGRFTPGQGVLEWVEEGNVMSLQSESLGLGELVAIAELLRPYR